MSMERTQQHDAIGASDPIIRMNDASVTYDDGESYVLDGVSLEIERGEVLGIVGESGSGKSMLASAMLDAVPNPGLLSGEIVHRSSDGTETDVLELSQSELRSMRWEEISMVFQGAMSSFNPTMKIRGHFVETLDAHDAEKGAGMERARELLSDLYLDPDRVLDSYPHELSGGMTQRALIALSLVLDPDLLVMDEPTAALDLLMQRSILQLLGDLREKYDLTMVFITHDLPLVAALADRLAVMYAFKLVEIADTREMITDAGHPYTRALLNSTPNLDAPLEEMRPIDGKSPAPINLPSGCAYHPRCPLATEQCREEVPGYHEVTEGHGAACFHWEEAIEEIPLNYADSLGDTAATGGGAADEQ
ncbi:MULTISPECIES: ABC transporter ATP-binding protein [Halococcus]|uniref:Peptide ABC transporter ATPase n=1 Tax=Halococcus salifodinae DSM 8989 TaxID=1227456 RepID=M0N3T8_9EURY|nr:MULTISPECIES: ABC transporter ATP-binding protein [Halococcus]EMA52592.1 peptide ABC transporter ATPase [Halococcus salifodinae DSM 8989]